jgi:hypothetical protein
VQIRVAAGTEAMSEDNRKVKYVNKDPHPRDFLRGSEEVFFFFSFSFFSKD